MKSSDFVKILGVLLVCSFSGLHARAHHSFPQQYDANQPATVEGMVVNVEWRNPHIYFYMDVFNDDGTVTQWAFEMANVSAMQNRGWNRNTLTVGDLLRVRGALARDGSPLLNVQSVVRTDTGEELLSGRRTGSDLP